MYPDHLYYEGNSKNEEAETITLELSGKFDQLELEFEFEVKDNLKLREEQHDAFREFGCTFPNLLSKRCALQLKELVKELKSSTNNQIRLVLDDVCHSGLDLRAVPEFQKLATQLKEKLPSLLNQWSCHFQTPQKSGLSKILESAGHHHLNVTNSEDLCSRLNPINIYIVKYSEGQSHPLHVDDSFLTVNICIENILNSEESLNEFEQFVRYQRNPILDYYNTKKEKKNKKSIKKKTKGRLEGNDEQLSSSSFLLETINLTPFYIPQFEKHKEAIKHGVLEIWHPNSKKIDNTNLEAVQVGSKIQVDNLPSSVSKIHGYTRKEWSLAVPSTSGRVTLHFGAAPHFVYPLIDAVRYSLIIWYDLLLPSNNNPVISSLSPSDCISNEGSNDGYDGGDRRIEELPQEILEYIYLYLPKRSVFAVGMTCKKLMHSINHLSFWRAKFAPTLHLYLPFIIYPENISFFQDFPLSTLYPSLDHHNINNNYNNGNNNINSADNGDNNRHDNGDGRDGGENEVNDREKADHRNDDGSQVIGISNEVKEYIICMKRLKKIIWKINATNNGTFTKFRSFFGTISELAETESWNSKSLTNSLKLVDEMITRSKTSNSKNKTKNAVFIIALTLFKHVVKLHCRLSSLFDCIGSLPWYMQDWCHPITLINQSKAPYSDYNSIYEEFIKSFAFRQIIENYDSELQKTNFYSSYRISLHHSRRRICKYSLIFRELKRADVFFEEEDRRSFTDYSETIDTMMSQWRPYFHEGGYIRALPSAISWYDDEDNNKNYNNNNNNKNMKKKYKQFFSRDDHILAMHKCISVAVLTMEKLFLLEFVDCAVYQRVIFLTTRKYLDVNDEIVPCFREVVVAALPISCFVSSLSSERILLFKESPLPVFYNLNPALININNNDNMNGWSDDYVGLINSHLGLYIEDPSVFSDLCYILSKKC